MTSTAQAFAVARALTARYGVRFIEIEEDAWPHSFKSAHSCPFESNLGIHGNAVLFAPSVAPPLLLHECGHVLFGIDRDEGAFLPWEWKVARWLGIEDEWRLETDAFELTFGERWCVFGNLSRRDQTLALEQLTADAPPDVVRLFPVGA